MSISNKSIQEVRDRSDIATVVQDRVSLITKGSSLTGLCPFHDEKTPSFHVKADSNFYHCFGCGNSGDSLSFVMKTQGLSFPDAIEYLANKFGIQLVYDKKYKSKTNETTVNKSVIYEINKVVSVYYQQLLISKCKESSTLLDYVKSRGLTVELIKKFCIGYANDDWDSLTKFLLAKNFSTNDILNSGVAKRNSKGNLYDIMRGRLIFPIALDTERFVAFGGRIIPNYSKDSEPKYINSPETPVYQKQKIFYGLPQAQDSIRKEKFAYLVEGYMDVIGFQSVGVSNVLATCGTALTDQHAKKIKYLCDKIIIIFDGDSAGRKAAGKAFNIFLNSKVDVQIIFLEEAQDPDTLAKLHQDNTKNVLAKLQKHSALACYVKSLLSDLGEKNISELTPVTKGKVAEKVTSILSRVENSIERFELEKQTESLLQINRSVLSSQIAVESRKLTNVNSFKLDEDDEGIKKLFNHLSNFEQELLYHIMYFRDKLTLQIVKSPIFCQHLNSETINFCEKINELYSKSNELNSDSYYKEKTKEYLSYLGDSWILAWKQAYVMHNNDKKRLDPDTIFKNYEIILERKNIINLLDFAKNQLLTAEDEVQQIEITQKIVSLSKKLSELKQPKETFN